VVLPAAGLAVEVALGRRWRGWEILENLGEGMEGFLGLVVFLGVVSPLHLDNNPFKGVGP
jgi:hypothetical protein